MHLQRQDAIKPSAVNLASKFSLFFFPLLIFEDSSVDAVS